MAPSSAIQEAHDLEDELQRRRAQRGLLAFTLATRDDFEVNWHHRRICQAINAMQRGWTHRQLLNSWGYDDAAIEVMLETKHPTTELYAGMTQTHLIDLPVRNLQIALPPRHGKSTLASISMPGWWFGCNPNAQMIAVSYSADLASRLNRDVQRLIETNAYADIFPKTCLSSKNIRTVATGSWLRNSDIFEIVGQKGIYRSAGVAGGVTGLGADILVCDDPLKNRSEADSAVVRESLWNWYTSTLYTRKHKGACSVSIATSWHEDDLNNRLRRYAIADPKAEQWFCLIYPAILDQEPTPGDPRAQGEAMWPSHFPLADLEKTRATIGTYEFEALYQQRPAPREGGIVKTAWLRFYTELPRDLKNYTLSADLTFGSDKAQNKGDFVAIQMWATHGADRYLIDQLHGRMEFTEQVKAIQSMSAKYPSCRVKLIEDAANGRAAISVLRKEIQGLIAVKPEGSKTMRLAAVSPQIESGNVYLPSPEVAPWVNGLVHELASFPNAAHDDMCDALSQALLRLQQSDYTSGASVRGGVRRSRWYDGPLKR